MTADLIVLLHFGFILFVIFGGLLLLKWHKCIWLHLPAVIWGVLIEFFGWFCPLTTLENKFRYHSNGEPYSSGFIEHYLIPLIYPTGLTQELQLILGITVIVINLLIYTLVFKKWSSQIGKDTC